MVLPILFASSSITSAIQYDEPTQRARYASCSLLSPFRRRRARRISLQEARAIAIKVYAIAEEALNAERTKEADFLLSTWDDNE